MVSFLIASGIGLLLIIACVALFYEILAHVWVLLPKLQGRLRLQILITILSTFVGHTLCAWLFGLTYYGLDAYLGFGALTGETNYHWLDYIYFSAVTYSSLGLGDVTPTGGLRLLVGVEAILGLVLIGWTITFTYLVMEKYLLHRRKP